MQVNFNNIDPQLFKGINVIWFAYVLVSEKNYIQAKPPIYISVKRAGNKPGILIYEQVADVVVIAIFPAGVVKTHLIPAMLIELIL